MASISSPELTSRTSSQSSYKKTRLHLNAETLFYTMSDSHIGTRIKNELAHAHSEENLDELHRATEWPLSVSPSLQAADNLNAPDGGYGWIVTLGSFLSHMIEGAFDRSEGIFLLSFMDNFGLSNQLASLPIAMASTVRCILSPCASSFCNKYSIRASVMLGASLFTLGVFLTMFKLNFYMLCFSYGLLHGIGRAFFGGPALIIIGLYFRRRQGVASGVAASGVGFGSFFLVPLFDSLLTYYGYSGAFLCISGVAANIFVAGMLYRPLSINARYIHHDSLRKTTDKKLTVSGKNVESAHASTEANCLKTGNDTKRERDSPNLPRKSFGEKTTNRGDHELKKHQTGKNKCCKNKCRYLCLRRWFCENCCCLICCPIESFNKVKDNSSLCHFSLLGKRSFLFYCLSIFLFTAGFKVTYLFLPTFIICKGYERKHSANVLAICGPVDTLSRIFIGLIVDLDILQPYRLRLFNLILLGMAVSAAFIPMSNNLVEAIITMTCFSTCAGMCFALRTVVLVDLLGVCTLVNSFGLLMFFQGFGTLIGPLVGGFLVDNFDDAYGFYFAAVCIVVAALFMHISITFHWRHLPK